MIKNQGYSAVANDGRDALRKIQSQSRYVFRQEEFARMTGRVAGGMATQLALQRLSKSGHVVLAQKQPARWLIIPAEHSHYGAPPVDWWLHDLLVGQQPSYYLALLSAARFWGSSHYAYQPTQVMVSRARRPLAVGKLRIEFVVKKGLVETPVVEQRMSVSRMRVSTREATVLDLIRHQASVGGLEAVSRITLDLARKMTAKGLYDALAALGQVSAAQRAGFIFEKLGHQRLAAVVEGWVRQHRRQILPLETPSDKDKAASIVDSNWNIEYAPKQAEILKEVRG